MHEIFSLIESFFHIKNLMNLYYITYKLIIYKPKTLYWFWKRVYRKSYLGPKSYNQINITYIFARIGSGPRYNLETRNQMGKKSSDFNYYIWNSFCVAIFSTQRHTTFRLLWAKSGISLGGRNVMPFILLHFQHDLIFVD